MVTPHRGEWDMWGIGSFYTQPLAECYCMPREGFLQGRLAGQQLAMASQLASARTWIFLKAKLWDVQ